MIARDYLHDLIGTFFGSWFVQAERSGKKLIENNTVETAEVFAERRRL